MGGERQFALALLGYHSHGTSFFFFTFPRNSLLRLFCLEAVKIEKAGFNFYFANTYKICCAFIFWFQNDLYIVNDKKMFSLFGLQMFEHMK